jgi:hypothetical protein
VEVVVLVFVVQHLVRVVQVFNIAVEELLFIRDGQVYPMLVAIAVL